MSECIASGQKIIYYESQILKNKYGIISAMGYDENEKEDVWIAYYPEDNMWEIERYLKHWQDYFDFYEAMFI